MAQRHAEGRGWQGATLILLLIPLGILSYLIVRSLGWWSAAAGAAILAVCTLVYLYANKELKGITKTTKTSDEDTTAQPPPRDPVERSRDQPAAVRSVDRLRLPGLGLWPIPFGAGAVACMVIAALASEAWSVAFVIVAAVLMAITISLVVVGRRRLRATRSSERMQQQ
jgi:membrane protein YdbS with pleckstrin-like domain